MTPEASTPQHVTPKMVTQDRTIAIALGTFVIGALLGGVVAGSFQYSHASNSAPTPYTGRAAASSAASTSTSPARLPVVSDFSVLVTITGQQCFGSTICNYEVTIEPKYVGNGEVDKDAKLLVVYEIVGGNDPLTANIRVSNGRMQWQQQQSLQAPEGTTFTTRIQQVLPQY